MLRIGYSACTYLIMSWKVPLSLLSHQYSKAKKILLAQQHSGVVRSIPASQTVTNCLLSDTVLGLSFGCQLSWLLLSHQLTGAMLTCAAAACTALSLCCLSERELSVQVLEEVSSICLIKYVQSPQVAHLIH